MGMSLFTFFGGDVLSGETDAMGVGFNLTPAPSEMDVQAQCLVSKSNMSQKF